MNLPPDPAPSGFSWPGGKRLAFSLVVNIEEGAENNIRDGDPFPEPVDELGVSLRKPIRMHGNETNYAYGITRGARRVLRMLDQFGVRATWTACSQALERAPWLAEALVARGDEACCHGWRWAFTAFMDEATEREFIAKGTESLRVTTGKRPVGWLSRYLHTDRTRGLLAEAGYLYHMDDYSDDFPYWDVVETTQGPTPIIVVPYAIDSNDMKFWLAPAFTADMWVEYACRTFDVLRAEAARDGARMMSLGLHLRIIGRPGRIGALERVLHYVTGHDDVWIASREEIARHFAAHVPPPIAGA